MIELDIIIRTATINDAEKVAKIKIEGWQTAYRGIIDDEFLDNMNLNEEIEKRKDNIKDGVDIIVAEFNNEIVGFCLYRNYIKDPESYPNADCEISSLYVKSSLKRKGIGTKLMQYVIQKLQNQGKLLQRLRLGRLQVLAGQPTMCPSLWAITWKTWCSGREM